MHINTIAYHVDVARSEATKQSPEHTGLVNPGDCFASLATSQVGALGIRYPIFVLEHLRLAYNNSWSDSLPPRHLEDDRLGLGPLLGVVVAVHR